MSTEKPSNLLTDNCRIMQSKGLIPPVIMMDELPISDMATQLITQTRTAISQILKHKDDRLVVVVGPCSIHDQGAALEYSERLLALKEQYKDELLIVMRVYFEKPRTTVGWKGYINDPNLDGSFEINKGLRLARELLLTLNNRGVPCGTEFLDVIIPQYIADLISWGAIGARTTESQVHRELASGLSAPIGFKNATDGNIQIAVDALRAVRSSHHFLSVTKQGNTAIFTTAGNPDSHLILRGGQAGPNYSAEHIAQTCAMLRAHELPESLMVDCSHGNSRKDHKQQAHVAADIAKQIASGAHNLTGVMLESHLHAGNQSIHNTPLQYGVSITDACMDWETTETAMQQLAAAVQQRRLL